MHRPGSRGWLAALAACLPLASLAPAGPAAGQEETAAPPAAEAESAAAPAAEAESAGADPAGLAEEPAAPPLGAGASPLLRDAIDARRRANRAGVETQRRIDELSNKTDELYARYNASLSQLASLRTYNERMREIVASQESELGSLRGQLEQVDAVGRSVTPLMLRMIEVLDEFVSLDIPFLMQERAGRIDDLRRMMLRADVTVSEKYRRIMEAYQIESEYGRTIEAYSGPLLPEGDGHTVDFLRFGRIALVYLTLDGSEAGVWDPRARGWESLDASYVADVRDGLRVARKQIPPDLIPLPLPVPDGKRDG